MNTTVSKIRSRRLERGSILVVCMVLAALGTLGVAAWFSLLDARSHQVDASLKALERRVASRNSRALAQRALYTTLLHANSGLASDTIYELPGGKGRATIRSYTAVPLQSNTAGSPARNGATPLSSSTTDVAVDLHDGAGTTRWTYRLRNHHPVLAGDLLTIHAPVAPTDTAPLVSGNLRVKGRAVFWDAVARDLNGGLRADEYQLPDSIAGTATFATTANTATLPLNYPHYLRTTGTASSGPAYRGELELLSATVNPQNSYEARLATSAPVKLNGQTKKSEAKGPVSKDTVSGDDELIAFIEANPPKDVADELSKYNTLSSPVLMAAIHKANPSMQNKHFLQIFDAQAVVPDDALTEMMASLDENDLDGALDMAIVEMNIKNEAQFNNDGKKRVQFFLDRPELNQVVVEDVERLRLFGQTNATRATAAAALPPLLIIVDNRSGETLDNIDLFHENHRPVILMVAAAPGAPNFPTVTFAGNSAFPVWRTVFELQNTGLAFDLSGVAGGRIVGGIRGNHRITVGGGNLTLEKDSNGSILAPLLSRDAWIETVRN